MTDLAKLVVRLEAETARYQKELDSARRQLNKFSNEATAAVGKIAKAAGAAALSAAGGFALLGKQAIDAADELGEMAQRTGASVETLSGLRLAAEQTGTSLEGLGVGLKGLGNAATDAARGGKSAVAAFAAIGVSATDAEGNIKPTETLLLETAEAFSQYEDGLAKSAVAQDLFGKSGQELIPFLNQGAEGIDNLRREADALGITISTQFAQQADEFNDNITKIKLGFMGVVNQALAPLMPLLNDFVNEMVNASKESNQLGESAARVQAFFKTIITGAIVAKSALSALAKLLAGVAAASAKLGEGVEASDFLVPAIALGKMAKNAAAAGEIIKESFTDVADDVTADIARIGKVWSDQMDDLEEVEVTAKKIKKSFRIAPTADPAIGAAIAQLRDFREGLAEQVATFGQGEVAALRYRLEIGSMADTVKKAGASGGALVESILAQAAALQELKNAEGVAQLDQQIQELTGHTTEAALAAFDLQNKALAIDLAAAGDSAGLEKLAQLRSLTEAQAEFNRLQTEATRIEQSLSIAEQRITASRESGAIGELESLARLGDARQKAASDLAAINAEMTKVAEASGNPQLVLNAEKFGAALEELAAQANVFADRIESLFSDSFGDALADFVTGTKSASEAFHSFINDIERELIRMASQDLAKQIFGGLLGGGGGPGGGILGFLGGLFTRDRGGRGRPGEPVMIGRGAQPEVFVPDTAGNFYPAGEWMGGGMKVSQNFTIQAPAGTVTRQTEQQVAAAAARGVAQANRRNN